MSPNLSRQLRFSKHAVRSKNGAVAAKNQMAADTGARILAQNGNAIDAAIAAAFALAVLEPWTSGLGSVGCMTVWDARKHRGHVVDFQGVTPRQVQSTDLIWPGSKKEENDSAFVANAWRSIAVPGLPDGLWTAHSLGTMPWPQLLAPAIDLSEEGLELDWYAFLAIGLGAAELARFPASRACFIPPGFPASHLRLGATPRLHNPALTAALIALAERGARDFYEGMIAHTLIDDLAHGGSAIDKADLRSYRAHLVEPATMIRSGKRFLLPSSSSITNVFSEIMKTAGEWRPAVDRSTFIQFAHAFSAARAEIEIAGDKTIAEWSSHISVIDRDGNMASLSQTLGSVFGSKIVLPQSGILMNNSAATLKYGSRLRVEAGERTVNHLLPMLGLSGDRPWLAIGVSGDRHILPTLVQLISFLSDFGFSVEDAFHQPRLGVRSSGEILIDTGASIDIKNAMHQVFGALEQPPCLYPFGRPCAVAVEVDPFSGDRVAMTEASEPWAGAAAVA